MLEENSISFIILAIIAILELGIIIWALVTFKHMAEDIQYTADRVNAMYEIMYDKWKREAKDTLDGIENELNARR